jgi:hypothetical protein
VLWWEFLRLQCCMSVHHVVTVLVDTNIAQRRSVWVNGGQCWVSEYSGARGQADYCHRYSSKVLTSTVDVRVLSSTMSVGCHKICVRCVPKRLTVGCEWSQLRTLHTVLTVLTGWRIVMCALDLESENLMLPSLSIQLNLIPSDYRFWKAETCICGLLYADDWEVKHTVLTWLCTGWRTFFPMAEVTNVYEESRGLFQIMIVHLCLCACCRMKKLLILNLSHRFM